MEKVSKTTIAEHPLAARPTLAPPEESGGSQRHNSNTLSPNSGSAKSRLTLTADLRRRSTSRSPNRAAILPPSPPASPTFSESPPPTIQHGRHNPLQRHSAFGRTLSSAKQFWLRNKGPILVACAQLFGALMNLSARLLEFEGGGMHPIELLLIRQSITSLCSFTYMWWKDIPDHPWGPKDIHWMLVVRGLSGFFGIFGMWYSMMYLPLADATVITFLAPGVAGILCYFLLRTPYPRLEQIATVVALVGVILIAQPTAFFSSKSAGKPSTSTPPENGDNSMPGKDHEATPQERLIAVGVALVGVVGGAGAFTTLRWIGKRAHPLVSVNAFGVVSTIICVVLLIFAPMLDIGQPMLRWVSPTTLKQWILLAALGAVGFTMQYLLTAGLAAENSNRANAMVYTHMLFAASFDRWVFGHHMGLMSFAGCALILGSAIGVILTRQQQPAKVDDIERQRTDVGGAEASPMLAGIDGPGEDVQLDRLR